MTIVSKRLSLLALSVALGVAARGQTPASEPKTPAPPPLHLLFSQLKPEAVVDLAGPRVLAVADDAVWVANRTAGTVSRIEAKTNAVVQTIAAGPEPCGGMAGGFGSLWVGLCGAPGLARIDLKTNAITTTIKTPVLSGLRVPASPREAPRDGSAHGVATANGSVWLLTDARGTMARFDPATNAAVAEVYLPSGTNTLVFGQGALWASSAEKNVLSRIDPFTNLIAETIKVGKAPSAVAVGEGGVWVLNQGDGTISRVDAKTNKVTQTIAIGPVAAGAELAAGEGSVWVSAPGTPLIRVDPRTNTVAQHFAGTGGGALAIGHGSLWLVATPTAIWRLDSKRIEATR